MSETATTPLTHSSNPSLAEVIERLTALATRKLDESGATDEYLLLSAAIAYLQSRQ